MARTALTPQRITSAGLVLSPAAANVDGHSIPLRDGLALLVRNDGVADRTVTIPTPLTVDGLAVTDRAITVAAGTDRLIALGGQSAYRQADGAAYINFDAVTSLFCMLVAI